MKPGALFAAGVWLLGLGCADAGAPALDAGPAAGTDAGDAAAAGRLRGDAGPAAQPALDAGSTGEPTDDGGPDGGPAADDATAHAPDAAGRLSAQARRSVCDAFCTKTEIADCPVPHFLTTCRGECAAPEDLDCALEDDTLLQCRAELPQSAYVCNALVDIVEPLGCVAELERFTDCRPDL